MINEIKRYENLIEVEITDFQDKIEVLYWEWELQDFSRKYQTLKAISFPMYDWRVVDVNRIQEFRNSNPNIKTLQNKISSLDLSSQETIRLKVKQYKRDNGKYPSDEWINNLIEYVLNPDKEIDSTYKWIIESDIKKQNKIKRIEFYNSMSEEEKTNIDNKAWQEVFKENPDYIWNNEKLSAKSLFLAKKMKVIKSMIK